MNWIAFGVPLAAAAAAILAAYVLLRRWRASRGVLAATIAGVGVLAVGAAQVFLTPRVQGWYAARGETGLPANPVYTQLRAHEPEVYRKVLAEHRRVAGDPARLASFVNLSNAEIAAVATRRLAQASQESLLALMRDMLGNLRRLQAAPGDHCYRYLFPQVAGAPDLARLVDAASQEHTLRLMAEVIRTAAEDPAPPPSADLAQQKLAPVVDAVYAQFGPDAALLGHADDPAVDRAKVCEIAVSLYGRVLELPPEDAAAVIRSMTQL